MADASKLAIALAQLQTRLPQIKKGETADAGQYSYTYADLSTVSAAVLPLLGELGLSFIAKPTFSEGRFVLAYSLLHDSGEREDGEYPLPSGTPQQIGSAITYGRRYCLCAVTGIAPADDDDDAAAASHTPPPPPEPPSMRALVWQAWKAAGQPEEPAAVVAAYATWSQGAVFEEATDDELTAFLGAIQEGKIS